MRLIDSLNIKAVLWLERVSGQKKKEREITESSDIQDHINNLGLTVLIRESIIGESAKGDSIPARFPCRRRNIYRHWLIPQSQTGTSPSPLVMLFTLDPGETLTASGCFLPCNLELTPARWNVSLSSNSIRSEGRLSRRTRLFLLRTKAALSLPPSFLSLSLRLSAHMYNEA